MSAETIKLAQTKLMLEIGLAIAKKATAKTSLYPEQLAKHCVALWERLDQRQRKLNDPVQHATNGIADIIVDFVEMLSVEPDSQRLAQILALIRDINKGEINFEESPFPPEKNQTYLASQSAL